MSVDTIMSGTEDATPFQIAQALLETFPFLTWQAGEALTKQLEFLTSVTNIVLPPSIEDVSGEKRLAVLVEKAKLINELLNCLYKGSELLGRLGQCVMVELYKAKSWEVRETLKEIQKEIFKLLSAEQTLPSDEDDEADEADASEELEALRDEIARERRDKKERKREKKHRVSKRKEKPKGRKSRSYCKHCGRC